ncbi:MAG TPA: EAL domain-containing protein [Steroidobacteraceae bacterium]|jgi:EAL domain-containing protein (putative c-di-GMP-specific phosphodiesterase class I)|nr:EAL domain-containing protein [Steroidobacteraceae bacterium]
MSSVSADPSATGSLDGLAAVYAHRIVAALPLNWAQRISMHDARGQVCWQSAGVWGPPDLDAVRLALERFVGNSAPARADHELPEQRTAVLLRAADTANVFRGFVMLVMDNRRLRGKGKAINDLPVPVQRAAQEWAMRLAAAPTVYPHVDAATAELSAAQAERLIAFGPTVEEPEVEKFFARLRAFPVALVAQSLAPLQRGMRIRRYEVFLREAAKLLADAAPVSLLRAADDRGLGTVLDRRVAGALIVWLAGRSSVFGDEPAQFSLNLSSSSLADPNFLRFIELCLTKAGIAPALLAFETDQSFWRKDRVCLQRLSRGIETLGAGLVIDNVTLHDELADLLSLPGVRLAKIDRRLTQNLANHRANQMRVAGMAQIARVAGVLTVAKQVEVPAEQALLRALGVDFVQGHAAAAPLPLDELDRLRAEALVIDDAVREPVGASVAAESAAARAAAALG